MNQGDKAAIGATGWFAYPSKWGIDAVSYGFATPKRLRAWCLGADGLADVVARAVLEPGVASDDRGEAVRGRVARDERGLEAGVVTLQQARGGGHVGAEVAAGVGVQRLHGREGGADVGLGGRIVCASREAEVRRDRDREQDPDDDDDDQELDEREALVTRKPHPQFVQHVGRSLPKLS